MHARILRVFNGCVVLIENSIMRVTVRLHEAKLLPEWRNCQFAPKNHYGFFFLHTLPSTIAFRLEYVLFYQFYTKITTFFIRKSSVWLHSYTLTSNHLVETDVKMMSRRQKWCQNRHTDIIPGSSCMLFLLVLWVQTFWPLWIPRSKNSVILPSEMNKTVYEPRHEKTCICHMWIRKAKIICAV